MVRRWQIWVVLSLAACSDKDGTSETDLTHVQPTDTAPPIDIEPTDTGGGNAPTYELPPTDIEEDCWSWAFYEGGGDPYYTILEVYGVDVYQTTHYEYDLDADGGRDYAADYGFDAADLLASADYDFDGNGTYDTTYDYAYDVDGLLIELLADLDGDGTIDERRTYDYLGGLRQHRNVDEGADGTFDVVFTYTYNAAGRVLTYSGDRGEDGIVDEIWTWTYVDPDGPDYDETIDFEADGVIDEAYTVGFDAEERIIYLETALTEYSSVEIAEYTWNADDDVISEVGSYAENDFVYYTYDQVFTYEGPGKVSTDVTTYTTGGYDSFTGTYTWSCP